MKVALFLLTALSASALDWQQWRGPTRDNKADASVKPVTEWAADKNVLWKVDLPGLGHSTPIIVGSKVFLTTSDQEKNTQSLIAVDRKSGKTLWHKVLHEGGLPQKIHSENSRASATPQWDGKRILTTFQNNDQIKVSAVSPEGKILWSKSIGNYRPNYSFGYGSTPTLHKGLFIISIGTQEKGSILALDPATGNEKWKVERSGHDNWSSPVVANVAGKEQLLISGIGKISSYDPATGKFLWSGEHKPLSTCGTIVWTKDTVFASGGFPKNETVAIKADGSGEVIWRNRERCYEQSLLSHAGYIYAVTDKGVAFCWRASDGKEMWKERIGRGGVMASPTLANGLIYASIKNGSTTIFKATHESFQKVATNKLGDDAYASPVILNDGIFLRVGVQGENGRKEMLYKLGK